MGTFSTLTPYLQRYKWRYAIGIAALIAVDSVQLLIPEIVRRTINGLATDTTTTEQLGWYGLGILVIAICVGFCRFGWQWFITGTSRRIERHLRDRFYNQLITLHQTFFSKTKAGDLMALATNDLDAVTQMTRLVVIAGFDAIIYSSMAIYCMLRISPRLVLHCIFPMIFLSIFFYFMGKRLHDRFETVQAAFGDLTDKVHETFSGIRVVKSFVQEDAEMDNFRKLNQIYLRKNMFLIKVWGLFDPFIDFIVGIVIATIIWSGGYMVVANTLAVGDLVAFNSYMMMLVWPMIAIGWVINLYQRGKASLKRFDRILAVRPEIADPPDPKVPENPQGALHFEKVTFFYPAIPKGESETENLERTKGQAAEDPNAPLPLQPYPSLSDVTFDLPAGGSLGVLGRTGSGKTTLINLMLRFYDPQQGRITLDGLDLREMPVQWVRRRFGIVHQDTFLFSETIAQNIAYARDDLSREEIDALAAIAGLAGDVTDFPQGFDSLVGERGVALSGGQRQRIAIARALATQAQILVFDDPFSAVDTHTEEGILNRLKPLVRGRSTILISHRVSSLQWTDKILVVDEGRVVESGTHEELLAVDGIYADIYRRQQLEAALDRAADAEG